MPTGGRSSVMEWMLLGLLAGLFFLVVTPWSALRAAVRIGPDWRLLAVASPAYLAANPPPQHPNERVAHNCINMRQSRAGGLYAWEFEKDGQELRVRVDGQLTFNTSVAMIDAVLNGYGIAYVPEDLVAGHVAGRALIPLLEDWPPPFPGYDISSPSRRRSLPAFKVIVDALRHGSG